MFPIKGAIRPSYHQLNYLIFQVFASWDTIITKHESSRNIKWFSPNSSFFLNCCFSCSQSFSFYANWWDVFSVGLGRIFEGSFLSFIQSLVPLLLGSFLHTYFMNICMLQILLVTPYVCLTRGANTIASHPRIRSVISELLCEANAHLGESPWYP